MTNLGLVALLYVALGALRIGLAAALVMSHGGPDTTWTWIRSLPPLLQGGAALLIVPIALAIWFWDSGWLQLARLAVVAGLAVVTLYALVPPPMHARTKPDGASSDDMPTSPPPTRSSGTRPVSTGVGIVGPGVP